MGERGRGEGEARAGLGRARNGKPTPSPSPPTPSPEGRGSQGPCYTVVALAQPRSGYNVELVAPRPDMESFMARARTPLRRPAVVAVLLGLLATPAPAAAQQLPLDQAVRRD